MPNIIQISRVVLSRPPAVVVASGPNLTTNLQGFWELGEASGTRSDSHGSNHLDSDVNTAGSAAGLVGNCLSLTAGDGDAVCQTTSTAELSYSGDFTVAGWINMPAVASNFFNMASKDFTSFWREWGIDKTFAGTSLRFHVYNSGGTGTTATSAVTLSASTWYFVVCSYVASSKLISISINDGAESTATLASGDPAANQAPFNIGGVGSSGQSTGLIDQVGFWKEKLSTEKRTWLYNSGAGRTYAAIAATA